MRNRTINKQTNNLHLLVIDEGMFTVIVEDDTGIYLSTVSEFLTIAELAKQEASKAFPASSVYIYTRKGKEIIQQK